MKKHANMLTLCSAMLCGWTSIVAQSQDDQKAYMDYMTPGPVQKMMAKSAGNWTGAVTYWMQPGAQPTTSTTEASNEMLVGGRYLQTKHNGNLMGMPFEGVGLTAYDNGKKIFIKTWVDNYRTGILYLEGTWDEQSKSINFTGKEFDPISKKEQPFRQVFKFIDENTQEEETYATVNGQEFKAVNIRYTRKQ